MKKSIVLIAPLIPFLALANPSECQKHVANFTDELEQPFSNGGFVKGWGPTRTLLQMSPRMMECRDQAGLEWKRQRVIAAADFLIKKKLNYCHHYLPDYPTPFERRDARSYQGGYCNPAKNLMPGSPYYQQQARWNYSGVGNETIDNWVNNKMWYGMDCSNYTTFLYNFSLSWLFSSNVEYQAGQRSDRTQINLSPNQQSTDNVLDNPHAAGKLVCRDNSLEVNHSCTGHGGYLSIIDENGIKQKGSITSAQLASLSLHAGDLLFIAASLPNAKNPSAVVHVVMWTGKKVGTGPNDIRPEQIAPNSLCSQKDWAPHQGDWVITDSHYQGADYRVLTPCYYLNNLWGVRRIIF